MKINNLKAAAAIGLSAMFAGSAAAQESVSAPVGYETISIENQFTYMGLRLVGAPLATSTVASTDGGAATITIDGATLEDGDVLLEVNDGDAAGAVVEASVAGGSIAVPAELLGDLVEGDSVTVREPQTLASVFGEVIDGLDDSSAGLSAATSINGADLVLVPNADGAGFTTYWYFNGGFNGTASWRVVGADGASVDIDANDVPLVYTDGVIVQNRDDNNSVIVSGAVKTTSTSTVLTGDFTYLSTLYPAGATLATSFNTVDEFGDPTEILAAGTVDSATSINGADLVLVPTDTGFTTYWYFNGGFNGDPTWRVVTDGGSVDVSANDVSFEDVTSVVIQNRGDLPQSLPVSAPSFYAEL